MEDGEARRDINGSDPGNKSAANVPDDIRSRVTESIIDCLKLKDEQKQILSGTTNLAKDFNLDSLDFVDLIMSLEERFSIEISDEEAQKLETVDDICSYIASKTGSS